MLSKIHIKLNRKINNNNNNKIFGIYWEKFSQGKVKRIISKILENFVLNT